MAVYFAVLLGIAGLVFGSFLNVCIYRIPIKKSIAYPPSACGSCGHQLGFLDLFPVFSYIFLGAKCRYCGQKISFIYPAVELLTGILFVLLFLKFSLTVQLAFMLITVSLLIIASFIDALQKIIPDEIVIALFIVGAIYTGIDYTNWLSHLIGLFAGGLPLLLIGLFSEYVLKKEAMGGGDVKLMAALGCIAGWKLILFALFAAVVIGALVSLVLIILKKKEKSSMLAFGPFLSIGFFCAVFFGNEAITWYLSFLR